MSNSIKNATAYGVIQNRDRATFFDQGDDSCDELLVDTEEPAEAVGKSNSKKIIHEKPEEMYSEGYRRYSEHILPRSNYDAQGINDYSELGYVKEISDKFSKMNTSSRISDSYALNPNTYHSDYAEVLEKKSQCVLDMKINIKSQHYEELKASRCFENHGLFNVSETPNDFCTKFKTLLGSNEKLITLDNVRDIKFKSKDFSELNCPRFPENKKHTQFSQCKDIIDINCVHSNTGISSKSATAGETSKQHKAANSGSNQTFVFTQKQLAEKYKIKVGLEKPNKRSSEKFVFNFAEGVNAKSSNEVLFVPKTRIENAPKRPKLKHRRIGLSCMQGSLSDLDTFQFDQRNSISFGLPNPNFPNCKNMQLSKKSRKRLASSPIKNVSEIAEQSSTSSIKRRTDNQSDEPSSKFRKRCLSSTDAKAGDTADVRQRVRSSSDGETHESVGNESF